MFGESNVKFVQTKEKQTSKIHFIKEGRLIVDPVIAEKILELNYGKQRAIRKYLINIHALQMDKKQWTPGSQIAFARYPDGSLELVNGQHRMLAVIKTRKPQEFQVLILDVKNEQEARALFHRFDVNVGVRSTHDILNSSGAVESFGFPKKYLAALFSASAFIENGLMPIQPSSGPVFKNPDDRLSMMKQWEEPARTYYEIIEEAEPILKNKLLWQSIMGLGLIIIRKQPTKAITFWSGLCRNDGLRRGDPRNTLRSYLLSIERATARDFHIQKRAVTLAWNAFFYNRQLNIIKAGSGNMVQPAGCR